MERTRKNQLLFDLKKQRYCVVLRGGKISSYVNYNNKKVEPQAVDNQYLTKHFTKGASK